MYVIDSFLQAIELMAKFEIFQRLRDPCRRNGPRQNGGGPGAAPDSSEAGSAQTELEGAGFGTDLIKLHFGQKGCRQNIEEERQGYLHIFIFTTILE
jgi:hypothetical protein